MVGNIGCTTESLKLFNYRFPELIVVDSNRSCSYGAISSGCGVGSNGLVLSLSSSSFGSCISVDGRRLTTLLDINGGRRHTVFVVASAKLQVGVDGIVRLSELNLLNKLHAMLEVSKVHAKHLVEV